MLKEFGASNFANTAYFNFEENPSLKQFFETTKDTKRILQNLSLIQGTPIHPAGTLILFDEIQECPEALNTLKYFCENAPEYAIAGAGSLPGITYGKENSFPAGKVDFLNVHPLSFFEFLDGADPALSDFAKNIAAIETIPELLFNHMLEKFRMTF